MQTALQEWLLRHALICAVLRNLAHMVSAQVSFQGLAMLFGTH